MGFELRASLTCDATTKSDRFNGLIQHSFALRMPKERRRFDRWGRRDEEVRDYFSPFDASSAADFEVKTALELNGGESASAPARHSSLARHDLTHAKPWELGYLKRRRDGKYARPLPGPFTWAGLDRCEGPAHKGSDDARFAFANNSEGEEPFSNDFLVVGKNGYCEAESISRSLLEILAHRRSLLFGLALADRFVNVMLPHAHLDPKGEDDCGDRPAAAELGSWILQPLVSLLRAGRERADFGRMYSVTFFLIPVESFEQRLMSEDEIDQMVNAGWSLAQSPWPLAVPRFEVRGQLPEYISQLPGFDPGWNWKSSSLREAIETVAFGIALKSAWDPADPETRRWIGDDVITSLGSARVSTAVVVDTELTCEKVSQPMTGEGLPGRLEPLAKKLAGQIRTPTPHWSVAEQRKHRLDRPFVDQRTYVFGVLPSNRCLVVASAVDAQEGRFESGLTQAASVAYMTIGAATAIGTMRAINHDLEKTEGAEPSKIADVEEEVAGYLHEIYDLDITREAYRQLYRRLRNRLGIARDYETLQAKMQALYRTTSTRHEVRTQARLVWLTAAIVFLSVLILLGTIVLAGKPA